MELTLKRFKSTSEGTFGILSVGDVVFYTVEKPWNNNYPEISCVPSGEYLLERHDSDKYGTVFCLINDRKNITHFKEAHSKRYACLVHVANYERDVKGCIGLGKTYYTGMVTSSRQALEEFHALVNPKEEGETHNLTITWEER